MQRYLSINHALYNSFKLRQWTGIPLTRICEVACDIAYDTLLEKPDLLQETILSNGDVGSKTTYLLLSFCCAL
jgi:hypothetical protein